MTSLYLVIDAERELRRRAAAEFSAQEYQAKKRHELIASVVCLATSVVLVAVIIFS